ncbi:MAG: hypothetical protein KDC58_12700 [Cyclobacteriaceae bacterium]|nr:hypothetical protein [Cyclobacteriaceae bacterium]
MKAIKRTTLVLCIVLAVISLFLIATGTLTAVLSVSSGILFTYYLIIYLVSTALSKRGIANKKAITLLWSFILVPILALIIDFEASINFLLQGVHLDMK